MRRLPAITTVLFLLPALAGCGGGNQLKTDPEKSFAHHYNLGMAAFERSDYHSAVRSFKRSISLNSKIARVHYDLGVTYLVLGENEQAVRCCETALQLDPEMAEAHNSLGTALFYMGNLDEAEKHFRATLAVPDYGTPFNPLFNLGNIYQTQERYELALETYEQAAEEENKITIEYRLNLHLQIGKTLLRMGRNEEAIKELEEVLVLNPKQPEALYTAAVAHHQLGESEKARQMLVRVINTGATGGWDKKAEAYLKEIK